MHSIPRQTIVEPPIVRHRCLCATVKQGWLDGLGMDAEGGLLIAAVFSSHIMRLKGDGRLDRNMPRPKSVTLRLVFGGQEFQDLRSHRAKPHP
jgi:sugar lactone lactonase YvrE